MILDYCQLLGTGNAKYRQIPVDLQEATDNAEIGPMNSDIDSRVAANHDSWKKEGAKNHQRLQYDSVNLLRVKSDGCNFKIKFILKNKQGIMWNGNFIKSKQVEHIKIMSSPDRSRVWHGQVHKRTCIHQCKLEAIMHG